MCYIIIIHKCTSTDEEDEEIPPPIPGPKIIPVDDMSYSKVYFDFETTGFGYGRCTSILDLKEKQECIQYWQ